MTHLAAFLFENTIDWVSKYVSVPDHGLQQYYSILPGWSRLYFIFISRIIQFIQIIWVTIDTHSTWKFALMDLFISHLSKFFFNLINNFLTSCIPSTFLSISILPLLPLCTLLVPFFLFCIYERKPMIKNIEDNCVSR